MRQLLLLRHAKSSWDDPKLSDHARPLNVCGRQAASAMARAMRELGLAPWDETPLIEPMDALYLAPAIEMLEVLRQATPVVRSLLLVGHNPGLHELALALAGAHAATVNEHVRRLAEGYPSGALAEFSIASPWSELREGGAHLTRFLRPADLSEANA